MRIVAGRHRGRKLVAPAGEETRPTSDRARAALFNILERGPPRLRGCRFLDLFAGTGAVALEALSRGAAEAVLVENARPAAAAIQANIAACGEGERARLLTDDAARLGRCSGEPFDIAFLDPPYLSGLVPPTLGRLARGGWLAPGARVVCELAADEVLELPAVAALEAEDQRRYGAARLVFLRLGEPGVSAEPVTARHATAR